MSSRKCIAIWVATLFAVVCCGGIPSGSAHGDSGGWWEGGSGEGTITGTGSVVSCDDYSNVKAEWCVDTDDGGASWHIYKISSLPDQPGGPMHGDKSFLSGSNYVPGSIEQECPADKYDYYIAYVFDGRVNGRTQFMQWGPIAEGFRFARGTPVQANNWFGGPRSFNGTFDELMEYVKNGGDVNGKRIRRDVARQFYKNIYGTYDIPPTKGFVCARFVDNAVVMGKSNVSLRKTATSTGVSDYGTSGENGTGHGIKKVSMTNDNVKICKNNEAYLTFSHSVLSNREDATANAGVSVNLNGLGYAFTVTDSGGYPYSARMSGGGPYEVGNNDFGLHGTYYDLFNGDIRYTDGTYSYFYRDFLKVKFDQVGTFNDLCETLSLNGEPVTQSCANITVEDCENPPENPVPGECGQWTPSEYTNSTTSDGSTAVVSKVRNNSVSGQNGWDDQVYAKPMDNPEWIHCYYPGVQLTANAYVTDNHSPSNEIGALESDGDPDNDYSLYNNRYKLSDSEFGTWQNQYTITSSSSPGSGFSTTRVRGSTTESNDIGDASALMFKDASYNVALLREGDTLTETNTSGTPTRSRWEDEGTHSWDCKWGVIDEGDEETPPTYGWTETCSHGEPFIGHSFNNNAVSDSASVLVPYNFINKTSIITETSQRVFAGEAKEFSFNVATLPKQNNKTEGYYATAVRNASWKLELCYDDVDGSNKCQETASKVAGYSGVLNPMGSMTGDSVTGRISVSIPDIPAGSTVCLRSAVFPATSGDDTNLNPSGDGQWEYSSPKCYVVAKRPSIEVWGGNVYSSGLLKTSTASKNNLAYFNSYEIEKFSPVSIYGSWSDSGIIASGGVVGFSSGAAIGGLDLYGDKYPNPFSPNNNNPLVNDPGGGDDVYSLCKRSPLTISNECSAIGAMGDNDFVMGGIEGDKNIIESKFVYDVNNSEAISGNINLGNDSLAKKYIDDGVYYYYGGGNNLAVNGYTMNDSLVRVVYSTGNITIDGDLIYGDTYGTFNEMPKLVIHAGGDIKIKCGVNRIDGVLVADGKVTTCDDADDEAGVSHGEDYNYYGGVDQNDSKRSRQLIVNGAIIAGSLDAGRTYGAATGANSIVPAEIISFDPSLYLWSGGNRERITGGGGDGSDLIVEAAKSLNVTYQKELAPRL